MSAMTIWMTIIGLGLVTYLMRASFVVFFGHRQLPPWAIRHLRYTAVAIIPGMIAPLIIFPKSQDGVTDIAWVCGSLVAILVGIRMKNPLWIMLAGAAVFILLKAAQSSGILS